jgi:hypothetical protein
MKDVGSFFDKALSGSKPDSAASSRNDGDLSFKCRHCYFLAFLWADLARRTPTESLKWLIPLHRMFQSN